MVTRQQFLMELRRLARREGKRLVVYEDEGKGSHYRVSYNGRKTTLKSGELTPAYIRLVKKQLGIV